MVFEALLTAILGALGVVAIVLQLRRVTTRGSEGVSGLTWLLITAVNFGWAAHMAERGYMVVAVLDVILALGTLAVAALVGASRRAWAGVGFLAVAAVGLQLVAPDIATALVIAGVITMFCPQALNALGALRHGTDAGGVAVATWALNTVISITWIIWGVVAGNPASVFANIPVAVAAVVVTAAAAAHGRRSGRSSQLERWSARLEERWIGGQRFPASGTDREPIRIARGDEAATAQCDDLLTEHVAP